MYFSMKRKFCSLSTVHLQNVAKPIADRHESKIFSLRILILTSILDVSGYDIHTMAIHFV